jgi:alkylation response protein AidB-like acyl-CoA dehydrogenase
MNFALSEDQDMMRETFARFLTEESSMARVRAAAEKNGFDPALWKGLAELGAFSIRVPEEQGGLGLGTIDAALLMEEAGRMLASGPLAETLVSARLLALLGETETLEKALAGEAVLTLAYHDAAKQPKQWVAGGAVANAVIVREGDSIYLLKPAGAKYEPNLASAPIAELDLNAGERIKIASGADAVKAFNQAVEEWKLLMAAALSGLAREAIRLASAYASERVAFGQLIGTYQAMSHPLADLIVDVEGGKLLVWKTLRNIADGTKASGAEVPLTLWWNADAAARAVAHSLHVFGGYGLTTEYDIYLYNLRAKAWPLVFGDIGALLLEAGARLYGGAKTDLPDVGALEIEFDLGEDARAFAKEVKAFFERTLTPELRAKAHYSWDGHDQGVQMKLAQSRLLFPHWPEEFGGRNATPYMMTAALDAWHEEGWGTHAVNTTSLVGAILRRFGSDEVKRDILSRVASGESICSLGYSEPGSGSDVFNVKTKATQLPDGSWRIDGQKMFTSGANIADYVYMLVRTDPDLPKHKGITMFIVPLKAKGVAVQPVYTFQEERTNITFYDGVVIPDSYRLGEVNGGLKVMSAALELEHAGGGSYNFTLREQLHAAVELCQEIQRDGRPLIEHPDAQRRLARAHVHQALSEVISARALWAGVEKKSHPAFGPMSKLFSTEKFKSDSRDLLDLTAPTSLSHKKGPGALINLSYRHAHGTTIYAGTSEVHRSLIAERFLGLPRTRG